jgi:hypothetical protein
MPKDIGAYELTLTTSSREPWYLNYKDWEGIGTKEHSSTSLLNVCYNMVVWLLENNYIKKQELKDKLNKLKKRATEIENEYREQNKSWEEYCNNPEVTEYWRTLAEYRVVQDYILSPLDNTKGEYMMEVVIMLLKLKYLIYQQFQVKYIMVM